MLLRPVLCVGKKTASRACFGGTNGWWFAAIRCYQRDRSGGRGGGRFGQKGLGRGGRRGERENGELELNSAHFSKLIHHPKEENAPEVTLDQLLEQGVIDKTLHKSVSRMKFAGLTSVQQKTIRPIVESKEQDVIARAKTGTGKTFAFLIPIFQHLINTRRESQYMVKCVIVAPTRDLALQIESEVKKIHEHNYGLKKFGCVSLVGGTNFGSAMRRMSSLRPNIVIATPGRLMAVLEQYGDKYFRFVDFKVLDEADRLLEIGFKEDLEQISDFLNEKNAISSDHIRTLLFSATLDEKVQLLAGKIMNKDECVFLDTVDKNEPEAHEKIEQSLVVSERMAHSIYAAIDHIKKRIEADKGYKAILFTPTVKFTRFLSAILRRDLRSKLPVLEFHGQIDQKKRTHLVNQFKKDRSGLLVCTDVGARGMDFPNVEEVLQIGVPSELANYIHRIGRTARGGSEGSSVIFLCEEELPFVDALLRRKKVEIKNQEEYSPSETSVTEFEQQINDEELLADAITSLISFYRSSGKEYGFHERRLLPEIASTFGLLLNDEQRRVPIHSRMQLDRLGFARSPLASQMFELHGDATSSPRGDGRAQSRSRFNRQGSSYNERNRKSFSSSFNDEGRGRNNNYGRKFYERRQGHNPDFASTMD